MSSVSIAAALRECKLDRLEAQLLLGHVLGVDRVWLLTHDDEVLSDEQRLQFESLVDRRNAGEPIAYILGVREFMGLEFEVNPSVLIPRPDTEILVELGLSFLHERARSQSQSRSREPARPARVLDLGTGSGAIAISIARYCDSCEVYATDVSDASLQTAARNAQKLGVAVQFYAGSWWEALPPEIGIFDLLLSNPPYIRADDKHLGCGDVRYEPLSALVGGNDGVNAYRDIVSRSREFMRSGAMLAFEHGWDQGEAVREIMRRGHCHKIETHRDLAGHDRVTCGVIT